MRWEVDPAQGSALADGGRGAAKSTSLGRASRDYQASYGHSGTEETDGQRTTDFSRIFRF